MLEATANVSSTATELASYKRKLIEVALPLQAINAASAREKSIRFGHPSTIHLWWARRPLAACRAVLFASLVDDPSSSPELFPEVEDQERERIRLFGIIEDLVLWENSLDESVLGRARAEIRRCIGTEMPRVYDPFCGGGAIPLEAQRLGLPTRASDLNPVAVLITKALTEIPWQFRNHPPVHPSTRGLLAERAWLRAAGLSVDVQAYGKWIADEAKRRIGVYYPSVDLGKGRTAATIAWLWTRTVQCSNPICGAEMPLVKSFALSSKRKKEWCIEPRIDRDRGTVTFGVRRGTPTHEGTVNRHGASCIFCGSPVTLEHIRNEGKAGRMGARMLAIVAEGEGGRTYLAPDEEHQRIALSAKPSWAPVSDLPAHALGFRVQAYGMTKHRDLFTSRQLLALSTFSDLVAEARTRVLADARSAGMADDGQRLESGGRGAVAYADAVATYLGLGVGRLSDICNALCRWEVTKTQVRNLFSRNAISMLWDFAEPNVFGDSAGDYGVSIGNLARALERVPASADSHVDKANASSLHVGESGIFATDPPYYDNVPYADLSDFFYVWLRPSLVEIYPDLFATLLVPKAEELVAEPARFGGSKERAREFFERGLGTAFQVMRASARRDIPTTIFYAFKQTEHAEDSKIDGASGSGNVDHASIGWEAMLSGLLGAEFQIVGTWPMNSELSNRMRGQQSNALASSIVLVCRPRPNSATRCSRADFVRQLRAELPNAVQRLRNASLAATDLQQAALGPGMAIFSKYSEILEVDDTPMTVRSALTLINEELTQIILGQIGDVDAETHFALAWFDTYGYSDGKYGEADKLLRAKNANLDALRRAAVLVADAGQVRLLAPAAISADPPDSAIQAYPAWAQAMHLLRSLIGEDGSEGRAGAMLRSIGPRNADRIKDIAYHCYLVCDRTKRAAEARDYNALVTAWPELGRLAAEQDENTLF